MIGAGPRRHPDARSGRRFRPARLIAAGLGAALGHLGLFLLLRAGAPPPTPAPSVEPALTRFVLTPDRPAARRERRRRRQPTSGPRAKPAPGAPRSAPLQASPSTSAPGQPQTAIAAAPSPKADYGRWTLKPGGEAVAGLGACTAEALASLTGAARTACEQRLADLAPRASERPGFPLTGDRRTARELEKWAQYNRDMFNWKRSPERPPRPCPPQDAPVHRLYLDKCALRTGAIVFRYRF